MTTIDDIIENFSLLDDWEDRYRYVIELGKMLEPLPDALKNDQNKVSGCASQVWLATTISDANGGEPALMIRGDSDAHIVRGLVAILLALCSGKTGAEILKADPVALIRASWPTRTSDAAALQRLQVDGGAHPRGGARVARGLQRGVLNARER